MKPLLLALLAALSSGASARAETETPEAGRVYLSWHAPYGSPRAASDLTLAPGDTTREDTLYFTCDPGKDSPILTGFTARLTLKAAAGDTLGPYWHFGEGRDLPDVRVHFAQDSAGAFPVPWRRGASGGGGAGYHQQSSAIGRLALGVGIATAQAGAIHSGERYVLARLLFRHPPIGVAGAERAVCIEWSFAQLDVGPGREWVIERGDRFASWNSPGCAVCKSHRGALAPKPWAPRARP